MTTRHSSRKARQLPSSPNMQHLKDEAKALLKAHKKGDPSCCDALKQIRRFADKTDQEILAGTVALQEVQFALALDYGLESWAALKKHVESAVAKGDASGPVRILSEILEGAVKARASDIHFEWIEGQLVIRYRIDGKLQENSRDIPSDQQQSIIDRMKEMCSLDVENHSQPQTGRIYAAVDGKDLDFRVSIMPYVSGESAVVRIVDRSNTTLSIEKQGLTPANLAMLREWENRPNGLFFVTGPTGSGKTTTMYSVLRDLDPKERKIITCEEPVEYTIEGINQQNVDPDKGLSLTKVLREVTRQDPDVIMINEIRDLEGLSAAIQMAMTGHLLFSSLHTNEAADGVRRLMSVAPESYRLNSCLIGVMAQRLIRIICPDCCEEYEPEPWAKEVFTGKDEIHCFRGKGCDACKGTGYRGRLAVQELLQMDDGLRNIVAQDGTVDQIREQAIKSGMITMRRDGLAKVIQGVTTIEEVLRVC